MISFILGLFITTLVSAVLVYLSVIDSESNKETVPANAAGDETEPEVTTTEFKMPDLEKIYNTKKGEKVSFYDPQIGYVLITLLNDVPISTYNDENYVVDEESDFRYYYENGELKSLMGIDVSFHQGDIDWQKVKNAGIDFAMIRVGGRGYETGELYLDSYFKRNIQGAKDAGIDIGVYFYSQAITIEEAVEEAMFTLSAIKDYEISYPVAFDWEFVSDEARTGELGADDLTDITAAFCETVKSNGYIPMVYAMKRLAYLKLDLSRLTDYHFWLAQYYDSTDYYYHYQMWQYSSTGTVDGIEGNVDLNIGYVDYGKIYRESQGV